jgi:hypothetical protein
MFPSFIVIGAAKCGTTSICDLLGTHPDVFMCSPKEPHYFSRLTSFENQREWYESLFEGAEGALAIGEGSTSYTHPHRIDFVVPRLRKYLPECRLIYMVRHPIRRLESDWRMRWSEGRVSQPIGEATDKQASLITFGLYWRHLSRYLEVFPDNQILVVFLEDFAAHPQRELQRIFEHVGVDSGFRPEDPSRRRNAAIARRELSRPARLLKRIPGVDEAKDWLPSSISDLARTFLTSTRRIEVQWDRTSLRAVADLFRNDSQSLLNYCGKPRDYWDLSGTLVTNVPADKEENAD